MLLSENVTAYCKRPDILRTRKDSTGVVYNTYQAACKAMGFSEDDSYWQNTLSEAAVCSSATSLRYLFGEKLH